MTPAHERVRADEPEPVLDVAPCLRGRDALLASRARARRGAAARSGTRTRRNVQPSTQIASDSCFTCKRASAWKPPSQFDETGERREHDRAERERAERGDEPERVGRRELLGVLHDVGNASRPWPAPTAA